MPPDDAEPTPLVSVAVLPDAGAARLLREVLLDHDIPTELVPVKPSSFLGGLSLVTLEHYDVRVPARHLLQAQRLRAELEGAALEDVPEEEPERPPPQVRAALLLALLVPVPVSCLYARAPRFGGLLLAVFVWAALLLWHSPDSDAARGALLFCKLLDAALSVWWLRRGR